MMELPYSCHLLHADGRASQPVELQSHDDADALLAAHRLKLRTPDCVGYEIRRSGVLIYRHEFNPQRIAPRDGRQTIMFVDDDAVFRMAATAHLRDEGFRVVEIGDAMSALDVFEGPVTINLLVTDVKFEPNHLHGIALARTVRTRLPGIPIIFVTGFPELLDGQSEWPVLIKPFDFSALSKLVQAELAGKAVRA